MNIGDKVQWKSLSGAPMRGKVTNLMHPVDGVDWIEVEWISDRGTSAKAVVPADRVSPVIETDAERESGA